MKQLPFWQPTRSFKRAIGLIILFSITLLAIIYIAISASNPSQLAATPTVDVAVNQPLRIAVVPARSSEQQEHKLQSLAAYLHQIIKRPVDIQIAKNYEEAVNLLVEEEVDMAYLGPLTYIKAHEQNPNIKPLVLPIERVTGRPWYIATIVAKSDLGINSLPDLEKKRFAFVSPSSTTGFLMAMNAFHKQGIDPTKDFEAIRYSGSHDKAVENLRAGEVDAIAIEKTIFLQSQKEGKLPSSNYKIIWESEPIPSTPIVINTKKFSPKTITELKRAFINSPEGIVDATGSTSNGYTLTKDSDFEEIRQIYNRLKSVTVPPQSP